MTPPSRLLGAMAAKSLLIDLEATCWERGEERGRQGEIIEIGAVLVDEEFEPAGEFQTFVKPKANPVLSGFCIKLTSITQAQVDTAPQLPEAMRAFVTDVERQAGRRIRELEFLSWGFYDRKQFERECAIRGIRYPFGLHRSVKHEFAERRKMRPCGMEQALKMLGIPLEGTHHRGIDDARNIARIFKAEWGARAR